MPKRTNSKLHSRCYPHALLAYSIPPSIIYLYYLMTMFLPWHWLAYQYLETLRSQCSSNPKFTLCNDTEYIPKWIQAIDPNYETMHLTVKNSVLNRIVSQHNQTQSIPLFMTYDADTSAKKSSVFETSL